MKHVRAALLVAAAVIASSCHPGPVVGKTTVDAGGTIAGNVRATGGAPLPGRKVTIKNTETGATFETTTSTTGGYTVKVPQGTYHIDVELRAAETFAKRPDDTHINNSDLDPQRDFEITVR
jgi:hypothetical protein